MTRKPPPWYLLTGLVIGLVIGAVYSFLISPTEVVDTLPSSLGASSKDQYRSMIAQAYLLTGNLERARLRVEQLKDPDPALALAQQAQRALSQNASAQELQALALLASAVSGQSPTATGPAPTTPAPQGTASPTLTPSKPLPSLSLTAGQAIFTATTARTATRTPTATVTTTPTPGPTRTITFTPRATFTSLPTLGPSFILKEKRKICDASLEPGLLQIEVFDRAGKPLPGVPLQITWSGGEETFYTGLFPNTSAGYADYSMAANVHYGLRAGTGGEPVNDLVAPDCSVSGVSFIGGWYLKFSSP